MRKLIYAALAATLPAAAAPAGPLLPMMDAAAIATSCDEVLARARTRVAEMESRSGAAGVFTQPFP